MHHGLNGAEQAFGRTGTHGDFGVDVHGAALQSKCLFGNRFAKCRNAGHRRVLIRAVRQVITDAIGERRRRLETGKPLCEIDRSRVMGQLAHDREYRRADVGEFAGQRASHAHLVYV